MPNPHIRPATEQDRPAIHNLAVDTGMFAADELDGIDEALDGALTGDLTDYTWLVVDDDGSTVAAAYYAPEPFADRLWNLYFIAVDPAVHGHGVGRRLLGEVERRLSALGGDRARIMLVETSSTEPYQRTRRFYATYGFTQEATIRDYYGPDDHKVVFWKRLQTG